MAAEATTTDAVTAKQNQSDKPVEELRTHCYNFWLRRGTGKVAKGSNYEDMLEHIGAFDTVEKFWNIYSHMVRPSELPYVNLSVFRKGIKPLWEDKANKKGGKFVIRVKKELSSHCWEALLLAMVGNHFGVGPDEISGCNISIRYAEDIISLWNRTADSQETVQHLKQRIRDILKMPAHVLMDYKPHFGEGHGFDMSPSIPGRVSAPGSPRGPSLVRERLGSGDRSPVFRSANRPGHGLGIQPGVLGGWRGGGTGRGAGGLGRQPFTGGGSSARDAHTSSWHPGPKHPHHHHHHVQGHQRGGFDRDAGGGGGGTMKWPRGRSTSGSEREIREGNEGGPLNRGGRIPGRPWNASGEQNHLSNSLGGDQSITGARWGAQASGSTGGWGRPRGASFSGRLL